MMSRAVVFQTQGLIDIRAFTTFGINSKPNSNNPIGFFGTGLKYAIAVLVREGLAVTVFIGDVEYVFYTKNAGFRDKSFDFVMMKKRKGFLRNWTYTELPFTTELGKNWKLWQAFRELESNTRDEQGTTVLVDLIPDTVQREHANYGMTTIIVEGEPFVQCYLDRDNVFLPGALTIRGGTEKMQILNKPSKHIYYRGLRVMDLKKPSLYTYNILQPIELTEDRTIKYEFYVRMYMENCIATSEDIEYLDAIIALDQKSYYEGELTFQDLGDTPSDQFKARIQKRKKSGGSIHLGLSTYYDRYYSPKKVDMAPMEFPTHILENVSTFLNYFDRDRIAELFERYEGEYPTDRKIEDVNEFFQKTISFIKDKGIPY